MHLKISSLHIHTERQQWKIFLTIDEHGLKIARNSVFNYHLLQVGRQTAIKNSVSMIFFLSLSKVVFFDRPAMTIAVDMGRKATKTTTTTTKLTFLIAAYLSGVI